MKKGAFSAFSSSSFNVTLLLCAPRGGIFYLDMFFAAAAAAV